MQVSYKGSHSSHNLCRLLFDLFRSLLHGDLERDSGLWRGVTIYESTS